MLYTIGIGAEVPSDDPTRRLFGLMKAVLLAALVLFGAMVLAAEEWPARPLKLITPYSVGGPLDTSARLVAAKLHESLGTPVVVENKAGAGGSIGSEIVARSSPDGYTFLMGANATHSINPSLIGVPYDPIKDFRFVSLVTVVPNVLVVNQQSDFMSVNDLVDYARRHPGKLNVAGTFGSVGHLASELFQNRTATKMAFIRYKGSAPAVLDLIAGHADLMFDNLASALPQIKAGKLRALAVTTARRSIYIPQVPTLAETGLTGFDLSTWWGVMAPANTPDPIIQRLSAEISKALALPDVRVQMEAMAGELVDVRSPEEFSRFAESELAMYTRIVKDADLRTK